MLSTFTAVCSQCANTAHFLIFSIYMYIPFSLEYINRHSGSVVERPLCDREVAGSIPGRVIPKTLKMVLAALSLGAQH